MASESSDDGHKSHPTPSLMPFLVSVALEAFNFAVGLMKQPPRQHEDGSMAGSSCSFTQDVMGSKDHRNNQFVCGSNRLNGGLREC
jgi:hypothetical protein